MGCPPVTCRGLNPITPFALTIPKKSCRLYPLTNHCKLDKRNALTYPNDSSGLMFIFGARPSSDAAMSTTEHAWSFNKIDRYSVAVLAAPGDGRAPVKIAHH